MYYICIAIANIIIITMIDALTAKLTLIYLLNVSSSRYKKSLVYAQLIVVLFTQTLFVKHI